MLKNGATFLDQELNGQILRLRVAHLPNQTLRAHDSRRKDDGDIQTRHEIIPLVCDDPLQMKEEELKTVAMAWRKFVYGGSHERDTVIRILFNTGGRLEQFVVDFVRD